MKPLAITLGDPAGIGPEIALKLLVSKQAQGPMLGVGNIDAFKRAADFLNIEKPLHSLASFDEFKGDSDAIEILNCVSDTGLPALGAVSATAGQMASDAIHKAIDLALDDKVAGIVTAPIHKEAFAAAGISYPGHTELLQDRAQHAGSTQPVAMMLANDDIRTVLVSIHVSLMQAIEAVTLENELSAIQIAHQACIDLGIQNPRVAVAGLNPHAGEGGLFGREEIEIIEPAIKAAQNKGIDASGPWSGDTVFMQARNGQFDVVVAQYHDQGLIPVKYLGLEKGVNVTLGLPFIRTSPDHGTAFDIAGKGIAMADSMFAAADYAWQLAKAKN